MLSDIIWIIRKCRRKESRKRRQRAPPFSFRADSGKMMGTILLAQADAIKRYGCTGKNMSKKDYTTEDDGRVIADMSGIERPRLLLPGRRGRAEGLSEEGRAGDSRGRNAGEDRVSGEGRVPAEDRMPAEDRRAYIFGAMGAAFVIGLIFLAAAAVAILVMILLWT